MEEVEQEEQEEQEQEEVEAYKEHGDGPPCTVETPLPDVENKIKGFQEDIGGGRQRNLSVHSQGETLFLKYERKNKVYFQPIIFTI